MASSSRRILQTRRRLTLEMLEERRVMAADIELVKDITTRVQTGVAKVSSHLDLHYENVNGILYFANTSPYTGSELWRTDGTDSGTYLVKDINSIRETYINGFSTTKGSDPYLLTNVNGTLFFRERRRTRP